MLYSPYIYILFAAQQIACSSYHGDRYASM
jgi:hypothetical protein